MRAYRFRLATVARIRALEERVAAERFMVAQGERRRAEQAVRRAEASLAALEAPTGLTTGAAFTWVGDQADRLAESLRECCAHREAVELDCTKARRLWVLAAQRAGVLERLEEHGFAQWRDEVARQEAAELDDFSLTRYGGIGASR